jgi:hypothetical protein
VDVPSAAAVPFGSGRFLVSAVDVDVEAAAFSLSLFDCCATISRHFFCNLSAVVRMAA